MSTSKLFLFLGSLSAMLAVMLGAFGAHALKKRLTPEMLDVFQTGVQYHFYHALGLLLIALLAFQLPESSLLRWSGWLMFAGILIFSGSLYILTLTGLKWLGAITPIGGTAFYRRLAVTRADRSENWSHFMKYALILFLFFFHNTLSADQNDERLELLFSQLKSIEHVEDARPVEAQIWNIWTESGRNDIDNLMDSGIRAMSSRDLETALEKFDQIVQQLPEFAEGWNKRATVYYLMDRLDESVKDVQKTLALEPRHFGAISGMGLIFMQVGDDVAALQAFEDVLKIYPSSISARIHIENLNKKT